jgi:hypothetical protein
MGDKTDLMKLTVDFAAILHTHLTHQIFTVLANKGEITTKTCLGILKFPRTQNIRLWINWDLCWYPTSHILSEDVSLKQLPCVSASHAYHDFQLVVMNFLLNCWLNDRGQRPKMHLCAKFTIEKTPWFHSKNLLEMKTSVLFILKDIV